MKTRMSTTWILGLALVIPWVPDGPAQNIPASSPPRAGDDASAGTDARATPDSARPATAIPSHPVSAVGAAPDHPVPQDVRPPANLRLSPWAGEVVKLEQAGIEENVLLAFIDNSGTFNLDADQIIYLQDLGVPSQTITAMLQHDAELVSGTRPLTSSTTPLARSAFWMTVATGRDAAANVSKSSLPTPSPSASDSKVLAGIPSGESPQVSHDAPDSGSLGGKSPGTQAEPFGIPLLGGSDDLPPGTGTSNTTFQTGSETSPPEDTIADDLASNTPSAPSQPRPASEEKKKLYPVREPYPVELTAPIVLIPAAGRMVNTVVIELFP